MATKAIAGKKATIFVDTMDASNFLNEYEFEAEAEDIDVAVFGKDEKDFIAGNIENTVTLTGLWNGDADSLDELLDETFGTGTENIITICPGGETSGKACYLASSTQVAATASAEADDLTESEVEFRSARIRGHVLKDSAAVTATGNGTAHIRTKTPVITTKGAAAHLHVLGVTGSPTAVAIEAEHSADGATWATLPGLSFTGITGPTAQKKETAKTVTVNAQLRAKHTITGGTTPTLTYVLAAGRRF